MTSHDDMSWGIPWLDTDALVFDVDLASMTDYPNGDRLPSIWVTDPVHDEEGEYEGRVRALIYPLQDREGAFSDDDDEDGELALYYGGGYYDEGMSYANPADHDKRVDCFRAAEVFYRHSAGRGNAVANLCLGYVYSYDRCEGRYWRDPMTLKTEEDYRRPYPREERAFECFSIAAAADIPEACYKLGDLCKHGTGCEPNAAEAFRWYARASELATREQPVILGSIALRLAGCYEDGLGCDQDFAKALEWYEKAVSGLEFAVRSGETWYTKALAGARNGVKRCRQEISG